MIEKTKMDELLLKKQPQNLEFSYETMCHTKILPEEYEVCIAIPQSKKYIGYITLLQEQPPHPNPSEPNLNPFYPVLIIYELNRFRKISGIYNIATVNHSYCEIATWLTETIFYGSIVNNFFIIEDLLYYKGNTLRNVIFKEKIEILTNILSLSDCFEYLPTSSPEHTPDSFKLVLPVFFKNTGQSLLLTSLLNTIPYSIHHIQYKSLNKLKPILNVSVSRAGILDFETTSPINNNGIREIENVREKNFMKTSNRRQSPTNTPHSYLDKYGKYFTFTFNKPQYKKKTVFEVMADIQYDVYLLYAYNNISVTNTNTNTIANSFTKNTNDKHIFVDVACISTYNTSKMMNSIFRNIKENESLDYIEESDDEDDFENPNIDKYVDLNKKVNMECQFNYKFKKWVPIRIVEPSVNYGKIIPISNL